jgi:hypothetical protein
VTDQGGRPREWAQFAPPGAVPPPPPEPLTLDAEPPPGAFDHQGRVVRRGPSRLVAGLLGFAMLAGGTAFAIAGLGDSGPQSPEAAVQAMFDAIENEDLIGVFEVLPGGERRAVQPPIEDIAGELTRLGVLDPSLDLHAIAGLDFDFDGLAYEVEELAPGFVTVRVTEGTVTSSVFPDQLPVGAAVDQISASMRESIVEDCRAWGDDEDGCGIDGFEPIDQMEPETETTDLATDGPIELVAVEEGGGWRVSLGYSIAEAARKDAELPLPPFGASAPAGAESPEAVIEGIVDRGTDLDLAGVFELLAPDELAALHDYAPLFLPDVEAAAAEARERTQLTVTDLELEARPVDGGALVIVRSFGIDGEIDGDRMSISWDGDCVRAEDPDLEVDYDSCDPQSMFGPGFEGGELDAPPIDFGGLEAGFMTVEVGGRWYLSPTRTVLGGLVSVLRVIPDDGLPDLVDWYWGMLFMGVGTTTEFQEVGDEIIVPGVDPPDGPMADTPFCRTIADSAASMFDEPTGNENPLLVYDQRRLEDYRSIDPPVAIAEEWDAFIRALQASVELQPDIELGMDDIEALEELLADPEHQAAQATLWRASRPVEKFVREQCGFYMM